MTDRREPGVPLRVARKGDLRRGRVLLVGTLALAGAILVTVFAFTKPDGVVYSFKVSELANKPVFETTVRVEGSLVPGTLCHSPSKCQTRFRLTDSPDSPHLLRNELEVRYEGCVIPDTFRDVPGYELSLVVAGELHADALHFDAVQITTRCSGIYDAQRRAAVHEALARPVPRCP